MMPRTSALAFFGFLGGLGAALCVGTAWFLLYMAQPGVADLVALGGDDARDCLTAGKILVGCAVLPSVFALAFWLAARGAVRESQGLLVGRGLYRTGVILAALALGAGFGGRSSVLAKIDRALGGEAISEAAPEAIPDYEGLGVEVRALTPEEAKALRVAQGVMVWKLLSIRTNPELRPGRAIVSVGGIAVRTPLEFDAVVRRWPPGASVDVDLKGSDSVIVHTPVRVGRRPAERATPTEFDSVVSVVERGLNGAVVRVSHELLGTVEPLDRDAPSKAGGVVVAEMPPGSILGRAGVRRGDRLTHLNGEPVATCAEFLQRVFKDERRYDLQDWLHADFEVGVLRDGQEMIFRVIPEE